MLFMFVNVFIIVIVIIMCTKASGQFVLQEKLLVQMFYNRLKLKFLF